MTSPSVCADPRSTSLVTTDGLMSTQTTLTQDGSMFPTPIPCSIVDSTTAMPDVGERLGVPVLRLDEIHDRVGQRAVVADAARQHERARCGGRTRT